MLEKPVMKSTTKRIKLDWGNLLGFEQVKSAQNNRQSAEARAIIGGKIGAKIGGKIPPIEV